MTRILYFTHFSAALTLAALLGCGAGAKPVDEIDASAALNLPKLATPTFPESDSPWWRDNGRDGHADGPAPTAWSENEHVLWKTPIPGRGHSSPTIVGDRIYLATAEDYYNAQMVLALDRASGEIVWQTTLHGGGFPTAGQLHSKSTNANGTVACDGERLYIAFLNSDAITLSALDLAGDILWQTKVCDFNSHYGHAASACIYESLVIIAAECQGGGGLAALHRETGDIIWRKSRPGENYSSAVVAHVAGKDQLLLSGNDYVTSFDPLTGETNWNTPGTTSTTCGTMVWDADRVFASGGFPGSQTICIDASTGREVWSNRVKCYEQSMLLADGYLYAFDDNGVAYCWEAATGAEQWKERLGGPVSASLALAGDLIYATNENGTTFVFRADPSRFELVSENRLGDEAFATPTISGGRLYLRVATHAGGGRHEFLYCIGE